MKTMFFLLLSLSVQAEFSAQYMGSTYEDQTPPIQAVSFLSAGEKPVLYFHSFNCRHDPSYFYYQDSKELEFFNEYGTWIQGRIYNETFALSDRAFYSANTSGRFVRQRSEYRVAPWRTYSSPLALAKSESTLALYPTVHSDDKSVRLGVYKLKSESRDLELVDMSLPYAQDDYRYTTATINEESSALIYRVTRDGESKIFRVRSTPQGWVNENILTLKEKILELKVSQNSLVWLSEISPSSLAIGSFDFQTQQTFRTEIPEVEISTWYFGLRNSSLVLLVQKQSGTKSLALYNQRANWESPETLTAPSANIVRLGFDEKKIFAVEKHSYTAFSFHSYDGKWSTEQIPQVQARRSLSFQAPPIAWDQSWLILDQTSKFSPPNFCVSETNLWQIGGENLNRKLATLKFADNGYPHASIKFNNQLYLLISTSKQVELWKMTSDFGQSVFVAASPRPDSSTLKLIATDNSLCLFQADQSGKGFLRCSQDDFKTADEIEVPLRKGYLQTLFLGVHNSQWYVLTWDRFKGLEVSKRGPRGWITKSFFESKDGGCFPLDAIYDEGIYFGLRCSGLHFLFRISEDLKLEEETAFYGRISALNFLRAKGKTFLATREASGFQIYAPIPNDVTNRELVFERQIDNVTNFFPDASMVISYDGPAQHYYRVSHE